jgi:hypothetical protein
VIAALGHFEALLILGPGEAKQQLADRVGRAPDDRQTDRGTDRGHGHETLREADAQVNSYDVADPDMPGMSLMAVERSASRAVIKKAHPRSRRLRTRELADPTRA